MGKGGSGTTNQNVTQTTSNIGPSQQPYYTAAMQGASTLLRTPYIPYGYTQDPVTREVVRAIDPATGQPVNAQRIADFTTQQKNIQQQVAGLQTPSQFGQATNFLNTAGLGTLAASQYDPSQFYTSQVGIGPLNYYQMQGPDSFTQPGAASAYMSPFVQQALEPQMREAIYSAKRGQLAEDLGAARQGTYGGSRQLLASLERERNLGQNLSDIYGKGMQTAFEQAQGQFNTEQQARQNAAMRNLEAALGVQSTGLQYGTQAALANQQSMLEAQRLAEQSRQFGASNALVGYGQLGQLGQTMTNAAQAQQNADLARLAAQQSSAAQEQALNQEYLTQQYQDFLTQRDYPYQQYQRYMNLLSGVPQATTSTTTEKVPSPGLAQQLIGGGLAALGTYKTFTGG